MDIDGLNFTNLFAVAEAIKIAALAVEGLDKAQYAPGISALRHLAGELFDEAVLQAQREGIEPRPLEEVQEQLSRAVKKLVN